MHKKAQTAGHGPHDTQDAELSEILRRLRESNLKITEPRKAILRALLAAHGPFTAEEIHGRLSKASRKTSCDLVTVYRCLTSLEKAGLLRRCEFGDGAARYELAHAHDHHHHVICKSCKRIDVLDDCELEEINLFAKRKGYSEVSHSLEFFGLCPKCRSS